MPREFIEIAAKMDFSPMQSGYNMPGGANVQLLYAAWSGGGCELGLRLQRGGMAPRERWTITCATVFGHRLSSTPCSALRVVDDHVLLAPYLAPLARLGFCGRPSSVTDAVGALAEAHWRVAGDWVPFDAFLNPQVEIAELLAAGTGVVAEGPRPILEAYQVALRRHGIETSVSPDDFTRRRPLNRATLRALLLTPSYVIGTGFEAQPHPEDSVSGFHT